MKKVPLKLRLFLAGLAFFALSGSANETAVDVTGTGRGVVSTLHRHGIFYSTASVNEIRDGAKDLARVNAEADADDRCQRRNGHLIDSPNSRNTTYIDSVPTYDERLSQGGDPVYVMAARVKLRCALPSQDHDVRISSSSDGKARLVTHSDGSVWLEGRGLSTKVSDATAGVGR